MYRWLSKILFALLAIIVSPDVTQARKKAVGSSFSYAGWAIVYEHSIDENSFVDFQLRMETTALFAERENGAGLSASFSWNMIFAETESRDGNKVIFFAGPGIMAGLARDIMSPTAGLVFGLKGRVGGECRFKRNVSISLSLAPVIGAHLVFPEGMMTMLPYKTGFMYGLMPEVGIKYAF